MTRELIAVFAVAFTGSFLGIAFGLIFATKSAIVMVKRAFGDD